jgi:hypothetical protein
MVATVKQPGRRKSIGQNIHSWMDGTLATVACVGDELEISAARSRLHVPPPARVGAVGAAANVSVCVGSPNPTVVSAQWMPYRFTQGRGRRTLDERSGRTKTIQTKCCMAVLFSTTRAMSWCNKKISCSETAESRRRSALCYVKCTP